MVTFDTARWGTEGTNATANTYMFGDWRHTWSEGAALIGRNGQLIESSGNSFMRTLCLGRSGTPSWEYAYEENRICAATVLDGAQSLP